MAIDVGVYLPQLAMTWDELRERVVLCDEIGVTSVWFMDHLYPPVLHDRGSNETLELLAREVIPAVRDDG